MHLRQPGFTYSACGAFAQYRERAKKLGEAEIHDTFIKTN